LTYIEDAKPENFSQEMDAIKKYLGKVQRATTKDITENVPEVPKNRAVVENYLLRLFVKDDVLMTRKGRIKFWSLNHIKVASTIKPIAFAVMSEYDDQSRSTRKFWFDLFPSPKYGDYIYIQESRFVGRGWESKGGMVLPINMVVDYVFHLLKMAIKSQQFRENHPKLHNEIENFVKEIAVLV
jgi:hypothetical protein